MYTKRSISILAAGALVVVAALGLMAFQTGDAQASPALAVELKGEGFPGRGGGEYLAEALGISVEELEAAHEQAAEAAIAEAVDADLITQAQADAMLSGRGGALRGRMGGWLNQGGIDFNAHLADALGISVDELDAAREEAGELQLAAAIESGRITQEQADLMQARKALSESEDFRSSMQAAFESAIDQAVASGLITQAQADLILEKMSESGGFGGFGGHHAPGGFGGPGGGRGPGGSGGQRGPFSPQTPSSTAPTSSF